MSVGLYDEALLEKLRNWTRDTDINIVGPNETGRLFSTIADQKDDNPIQLPLISLTRPGGFSVLRLGKSDLSNDGFLLDANRDTTVQLNAIPISIPYQLDVYTRYQEECDQYIRNLVFNIINYPKLDVYIPYNDEGRRHSSNIRMQAEVENNSGIAERLVPGQFTRMTIRLDVDDAYLFNVKYRTPAKVCPNCVDVQVSDNELR